MKKIILGLALLILSHSFALAQAPTKLCISTNGKNCVPITSTFPLPVTPLASGVLQDVNIQQISGATVQTGHGTAAGSLRVELPTDGTGTVGIISSSNVIGKVGIDQTTPGTTNLVSAGFSQQIASTPTVSIGNYVSGNCIGGFNAITVTANNGQSGFVVNFRLVSLSGQISSSNVTVYLFDSNPSASTCTDKSTFTLNNADVDKLIAAPVSMTPAAPTGATASIGALDFTPPRPFIAGGSTASGVKTIYYGLVSGSSFGLTSTSDVHIRAGVALN